MENLAEKKVRSAVKELIKMPINSAKELMAAKRIIARKNNLAMLKNSDILKEYGAGKSGLSASLRRLLRKREVRTLSGIAPVAVLTMPYACPGKCAYCPTEKDVPQSYLSNEPAVMRAIRCNYNPYLQVQLRLRALEANGHEPTKIELIVIGGTWSVLPEKYKYWFVKECFRAANEYTSAVILTRRFGGEESRIERANSRSFATLRMTMLNEQKKNEKAKYKIIGLTLETRPDYIDEKELWEMRELGCTRVELGIQAIDDKILKLNRRGHGVAAIIKATKLLKDFGFKVTYHLMPGLPGATAKKDLVMFKTLFNDSRFQPDQIKFYPTVVTRGSLLYRWWKAGKYKPYGDKVLRQLIIDCKKAVPEYVRIIRLIRDIPGESIMAGNKITNLRQVMADSGAECRCIRCREPKELRIKNYELRIKSYQASDGEEYFISVESKDKKVLYGFCRLRLSHNSYLITHISQLATHNNISISHNSQLTTRLNKKYGLLSDNPAIIRELHVYGELAPVGKAGRVQHSGLGKLLLAEAEKIARENGFKKMMIISGIGARGYYRKLGYRLNKTYMVKRIFASQALK
ncbi:MAG: tRNA uridine(34) 5-carboxymethylaminomethyl modification radical SAM/GNAT enzyme Elp3 [Patescibacteria group bacterium]|jgi:elongator complex protein 3